MIKMWKLIQKIFKKSKNADSYKNEKNDGLAIVHSPKSLENILQSSCIEHKINNADEFDLNIKSRLTCEKKLSDFEILVNKLNSYSGYIREHTLRDVEQNFSSELFPHILDRLSDYVAINRELAQSHIMRWSKESSFSTLSITNFLLIASLDVRDRTDKKFIQVFFNAIKEDATGLENVLMTHQGKLSRVLLDYVIKYKWIDHERLLEVCSQSKYQIIRNYWLDEIIAIASDDFLLNVLKQSPYKDVQYRILDVLYSKDILTIEDLVELWESKYYSIMDYAYFILRRKDFNFDLYFKNIPVEKLTSDQAQIRASQWLLVNGNIEVFFEILNQITSKYMLNSLLFKALKQKYLSLDVFLDFADKTQRKLEFWYLLKLKKYTETKLSLDQIEKYFSLIKLPVSLIPRLQIVDGCNSWDELYWFVIQYQFINTKEDKEYFDWYISKKIYFLHHEKYPPHWSLEQQEKFKKLIPTFYKQYKDLLSHANIQHILNEYL